MTKDEIEARSFQVYPKSEYMRDQWVKWTVYLYESGKHMVMSGKYPK